MLAITGMDTLELVSRLQRSDMDDATLDGLRVMADRLCSEYPFMPATSCSPKGGPGCAGSPQLRGQRLTLKQHREILVLAGWIALLIACVEYDTGNRQAAETTRRAALSLGTEADHAEITGWAHEMRAWMNLTTGDYHGVDRCGPGRDRGRSASAASPCSSPPRRPRHGPGSETGARPRWRSTGDGGCWTRMPYPENLDHHFVVDPTKFDFYAMDCYRHLAEDKMAETLADEVIRASTDFDGTERAPMRIAEARITLASSPPAKATWSKPSTRANAPSTDPQVPAIAPDGQP